MTAAAHSSQVSHASPVSQAPRVLHGLQVPQGLQAPQARAARGPAYPVEATLADDFVHDGNRIALPRAEIHVVARFGPSAQGGLDVHAMGGRQSVHRKLVRGGHKAVMVRLRLGTPLTALGASAPELADRIVALEDLWGEAAKQRLCDELAAATDTAAASVVLARTIAERLTTTRRVDPRTATALAAADRLVHANVNQVALDLGVSERHLRRLFHDVLGLGPKAFARLARFQRALVAARTDTRASWAGVAVAAGYYDQAHLIAEFRAIAGVTPRAFLDELRAAGAES